MRENRVKKVMGQGQLAIGGYVSLADPQVVEIIGLAGFDAAFIDMEHTAFDLALVGEMIRAADLVGATSIVRVPDNDAKLILRILDTGAEGIVVPHINSRADAEQAMQSAKYAPLGYRGMFGGRQSFGVADYFHQANGQTMVVVLLEEAEALENLDEILQVDNIDVFFVAPSDLAQTMGHLGDAGHPEVQSAIDGAIAKIVSAGRTAGTLVNDNNLAGYVEKGARFLMTSWNGWVTRGAAEFLSKVPAGRT